MPDGDDRGDTDGEDPGERLASAYPEPDPETDLPDPESELPSVPSPPSVDVPTPPSSESDAPRELVAGFWTTVLVVNVAVLATSLGLLLLGFGVQRRLGVGALVVGAVAAVHGYTKYRSLAERHRSGEWRDDPAGEDPTSDDSASDDSAGDELVDGGPVDGEPVDDGPRHQVLDGSDERNG